MDNERRDYPPGRPSHKGQPARLGVEAPSGEVPHAQDHWRVDLGEQWEVSFWSREFGCSESELKNAVATVGPGAGAVRAYLATQIQQQRR